MLSICISIPLYTIQFKLAKYHIDRVQKTQETTLNKYIGRKMELTLTLYLGIKKINKNHHEKNTHYFIIKSKFPVVSQFDLAINEKNLWSI